ncbi:hypothetical protein ACJ8BA_28155, partial [Klebsiella pneumoniae]
FGCLTFGFYRVSLVFAFIVKRFRVFRAPLHPALLFCRLKIPCVFLLPDLQNDRAATVPAAP